MVLKTTDSFNISNSSQIFLLLVTPHFRWKKEKTILVELISFLELISCTHAYIENLIFSKCSNISKYPNVFQVFQIAFYYRPLSLPNSATGGRIFLGTKVAKPRISIIIITMSVYAITKNKLTVTEILKSVNKK